MSLRMLVTQPSLVARNQALHMSFFSSHLVISRLHFSSCAHLAHLLLRGLHGLKHAKPGGFHISNGLILILGELLICGLELLDLRLEVGFGVLQRLLALGDLSIEVCVGHGEGLLDLSFLVGITQVEVGRSTGRSKVLLGKLLEIIERAAALEVLQVVRITVLDGRISLDTVLAAQVLVNSAVDVANESSL